MLEKNTRLAQQTCTLLAGHKHAVQKNSAYLSVTQIKGSQSGLLSKTVWPFVSLALGDQAGTSMELKGKKLEMTGYLSNVVMLESMSMIMVEIWDITLVLTLDAALDVRSVVCHVVLMDAVMPDAVSFFACALVAQIPCTQSQFGKTQDLKSFQRLVLLYHAWPNGFLAWPYLITSPDFPWVPQLKKRLESLQLIYCLIQLFISWPAVEGWLLKCELENSICMTLFVKCIS